MRINSASLGFTTPLTLFNCPPIFGTTDLRPTYLALSSVCIGSDHGTTLADTSAALAAAPRAPAVLVEPSAARRASRLLNPVLVRSSPLTKGAAANIVISAGCL